MQYTHEHEEIQRGVIGAEGSQGPPPERGTSFKSISALHRHVTASPGLTSRSGPIRAPAAGARPVPAGASGTAARQAFHAGYVHQQQRCGNFLLAVLKYPDVIDDAQQNYAEPAEIDYCQTAPFDIDS